MVSSPSSAATDARKRERVQKKNDLHKSIIHREGSAAAMLAARLHGSILTAPADSPCLISAVAASPFILRKIVSDWHKLFSLSIS